MRFLLFALAALLAAADPAPPAPTPVPESAIPAPVLDADGKPRAGWIRLHEAYVARAKAGNVGLLFLGDSITQGWSNAPQVWEKEFSAWKPANFGIGGDRTQNVLWRIANGELDGIQPKVVVLMIGTNNIGDEFEAVAKGVTAVVEAIRAKLPQSKILLLGIFPRGKSFWDGGRRITRNANGLLAKLHDGRQIHYLDLTDRFVQKDETLLASQFPDNLHPSPEGYQVWADAMRPTLTALMTDR